MTTVGTDQCFVVMPFGSKPLNDGSGRTYDFDKVYRVIIRRAIREAGLEPLRADERTVSDIIHADMFKNLRDRAVVLADLSLENPNVFYELGARHVMSAKGTVLMCRMGSDLPFDVKLSRVIFYDFDGSHLDYEEVERVVPVLVHALDDAKRGEPDSPVHALLERVLPAEGSPTASGTSPAGSGADAAESLDDYQLIVAQHWAADGKAITDCLDSCASSVFGCRALGRLALTRDSSASDLAAVARRLYHLSQYDLASQLYEKLDESDTLELHDRLDYGSTLSELRSDVAAADEGLVQVQRVDDMLAPQLADEPLSAATLVDAFRCSYRIAGLYRWRWQLSHSDEDLARAIEYYEQAMDHGSRLDAAAENFAIGRLASCHLTLLLLLRIRDDDPERDDREHHLARVLDLKVDGRHEAIEESYTRWCQAITLADGGDDQGSNRMAMHAFSEDAKVMDQPGCEVIGRKQYVLLRRYLEAYSSVLRHPSLIGRISQMLQAGHPTRA